MGVRENLVIGMGYTVKITHGNNDNNDSLAVVVDFNRNRKKLTKKNSFTKRCN